MANHTECGDNGYGGSCGECPPGPHWSCQDNKCVCTLDCADRICGSDGCGGSCGTCDDGLVCHAPDGLCYPKCDFENTTFDGLAFRVDSLNFSGTATEGNALDVDLDPGTCTPTPSCDGGLDNAFAEIVKNFEQYSDFSAAYASEIQKGELVLLIELDQIDGDYIGAINLFHGQSSAPLDECDWQSPDCAFSIDEESMHIPTCGPTMRFEEVSVAGSILEAWGDGAQFLLNLPLSEDGFIPLHVEAARLRTTWQPGSADLDDGILAGAIHKQALLDSLAFLPPEPFPVSPELFQGMMDMFMVTDIDLDGDGELDATSVAFTFSAVGATISGVATP